MTAKYRVDYMPPIDDEERLAVKQCAHGLANAEQQKMALKWIVENAGMAYDSVYLPSERDSAFASGRRAVGLWLVSIMNRPLK